MSLMRVKKQKENQLKNPFIYFYILFSAGDLEIVRNGTRRHTRDVGTTFPSPHESRASSQSLSSSSRGDRRGGGAGGGGRSYKHRKSKRSPSKFYPAGLILSFTWDGCETECCVDGRTSFLSQLFPGSSLPTSWGQRPRRRTSNGHRRWCWMRGRRRSGWGEWALPCSFLTVEVTSGENHSNRDKFTRGGTSSRPPWVAMNLILVLEPKERHLVWYQSLCRSVCNSLVLFNKAEAEGYHHYLYYYYYYINTWTHSHQQLFYGALKQQSFIEIYDSPPSNALGGW